MVRNETRPQADPQPPASSWISLGKFSKSRGWLACAGHRPSV